jgi:hypothetical protein
MREDPAEAADLRVRYSNQFTDLAGAWAEAIQHNRHEVRCACGQADGPRLRERIA